MKKYATVLGIGVLLMLLVLVIAPPVVARPASNVWHVPGDFETIQDAINSDDVLTGDTLLVGPGHFAGASVDKGVNIRGVGHTVIDSGMSNGPYGDIGFFLSAGSDGASISHLTFEVGLPIYARWADDVEVHHCIFNDSFQAITNWGGSNWRIHHNVIHNVITIYDKGGVGGTPIVIGARQTDGAVTARDNIVSQNMISGKILFHPDDDGSEGDIYGIALVAIAENGQITGNEVVSGNHIHRNQVSLSSDEPDRREVVALGLQDWRGHDSPPSCTVIFHNTVVANDFRGADLKFDFDPETLEDCNLILRNK